MEGRSPTKMQTPTSIESLEREYTILLRDIDSTQQHLRNAISRYNELKYENDVLRTAEGVTADRFQQRLEELAGEEAGLEEQHRFLAEQIISAQQLYQKACSERESFENQRGGDREKDNLEREFLEVRRRIAEYDPSLPSDAELLRAALAEQRYELYVLQSHLNAVKKSKESSQASGNGALSSRSSAMSRGSSVTGESGVGANIISPAFSAQQSSASPMLTAAPSPVQLSTKDVVVPVERGKLRIVTGPRGDGLKKLRDVYQVMAFVVAVGDNVGIKVSGHVSGVDQCVHELQRKLR